ncbi:hypothetical protein HanIR_Chr17g0848431 [Helianthus annuus]|nr:hypothetical protein HanIR_Chr17g0848431 [Helianthus annuus]
MSFVEKAIILAADTACQTSFEKKGQQEPKGQFLTPQHPQKIPSLSYNPTHQTQTRNRTHVHHTKSHK